MPQEFKLILKHADQPGYTPDIECYLRHGGYDALKKYTDCLTASRSVCGSRPHPKRRWSGRSLPPAGQARSGPP